MTRRLFALAVIAPAAHAQMAKVRVGWCARTVTSAATPFAIATKMGWYREDGIDVELVPLAGSGDCTKTVVTKLIADINGFDAARIAADAKAHKAR